MKIFARKSSQDFNPKKKKTFLNKFDKTNKTLPISHSESPRVWLSIGFFLQNLKVKTQSPIRSVREQNKFYKQFGKIKSQKIFLNENRFFEKKELIFSTANFN